MVSFGFDKSESNTNHASLDSMCKTAFINKILGTIFLVIFLIAQPSQVYSQINPLDVGAVFRDDVVPRIDIIIEPALFEKMMIEYDKDTLYPANIRFSNSYIEEELDSVGIRIRGNVSRQSDKKSLKISANAFIKGGKLLGIEDINLIANPTDPLMLRPRLAYYIAREIGITTLNTNYVRLYVNTVFKGIYIISE